jgi:hypothetical protein
VEKSNSLLINNKNMALNTTGLQEAFTRKRQGTAKDDDLANLDYAQSKGWVPTGATKIANEAELKSLTDTGLTGKDIYRQGKDIYKLPSINTTLDPEDPTPDIQEPEEVDDISGLMAGLDTTNKGTEALLKEINKPLPEEKKITEREKRVNELSEDKAEVQETALDKAEEFGYTKNIKELQNIMPQIAKLKADYDKIAEENLNRPISSRIIGGTADRIARQKAVELSGLSAIAQAYQGNIQLATQTAQDMVDMELAPIQTRIDNQKFQIDQLEGQLTDSQSKKAESLNLILNERQREINNEKEKKTNIANLGLQAAQNGASQVEIEKIMKSDNYLKALQIASPYLGSSAGDWSESDITDANGNPMLFNKSTGEYKTVLGTSTSDIYFTDANGDSWNIAGWATDQTKPRQMDEIAKRIGKVTDENINEKVKEFTPGLTADMIKEASAMSGVSWEAIMTMVVQESTGGTSPVAKKNNNFGGLTFNSQEWIKQFGGVKGTERPSAEGGNYIKFPTKQDGLNAMSALMASYGKIEDSTPTADPEITSYSEMVANGDLTEIQALQQISDAKKPELVKALAGIVSPNDTTQDLVAKEKATMALNLIDHRGLNNAVGTIGLGRKAPFQWGQKADFINSVEQLVSDLSLESLIQAKSRGATFGALSDSEMKVLASAATTIGNMRIYDKSGNVKGYRSTEGRFKEELEKISKTFLRGIKGNIENMDITSDTMTSTSITSGTTSSGINYTITE